MRSASPQLCINADACSCAAAVLLLLPLLQVLLRWSRCCWLQQWLSVAAGGDGGSGVGVGVHREARGWGCVKVCVIFVMLGLVAFVA